MGVSVYAENMGFFHKGSGGQGVALADVCLSPPPPPTGPAPIPYVNTLSASDLAKGSKRVKIEGEPTALENASEVSTSTGDEGGTQGGNVVTHKTKGKGHFLLWSFTVLVEGKGVARHGDTMGQNTASDPPGCVNPAARTAFLALPWVDPTVECDPYPGNQGTNPEQDEAVRGGPCWQCKATDSSRGPRPAKGGYDAFAKGERFTADHQPPQKAAWHMGGCADSNQFAEWAKSSEAVMPHCKDCSCRQGGVMSHTTPGDIQDWS
jgi:uncharacterized Zn-binding protein involved in type VI secretion